MSLFVAFAKHVQNIVQARSLVRQENENMVDKVRRFFQKQIVILAHGFYRQFSRFLYHFLGNPGSAFSQQRGCIGGFRRSLPPVLNHLFQKVQKRRGIFLMKTGVCSRVAYRARGFGEYQQGVLVAVG